MNLVLPLAVGAAVYVLSKRAEASAGETPEQAAVEPTATLGGPDGAASTAGAGAPVTQFPVVGTGGGAGVVKITAPEPGAGATCCPRKPRSKTQTFGATTITRKQASATESQQDIRAALGSIAFDLRF